MAQRRVEHAAFAKSFAPTNRVIAGGLLVRLAVEGEQAMDGAAIETFDNVDFVADGPRGGQMFDRGMLCILVQATDGGLGTMSFKFAAEHFDVGPEAVEG